MEQVKNKKDNRERRSLVTMAPAIPEGSGRLVEGYASVFGEESVVLCDVFVGEFTEVIERGAFDGVVAESDVLALLNHDPSRGLLARSKYGEGTLKLTIDERGLKYSFEAPNTALGDELLEGIKRGDITASSFGFEVAVDEWDYSGEVARRTIKKVARLYDVSPVYTPAYNGTSVSARSVEMASRGSEGERDKKAYKVAKYKYI